ncbi:MAG: hypothetical protein JSR26_12660 [Proteobacteria bacterium]|nr:hypothetical protein [Pseudomonadota bacterium]
MAILQSVCEDEALLALRRSLWQLAMLGVVMAILLPLALPGTGTIALWCALAPLAALATHYRNGLRHR